ncbi:hypothetical protein EE612_056212 [Oryza sativa]|uniref:Zinc-finger domain-containing protein n=2 Tax=Oryza TaxID=4527 RepID=A0A0E0R9U8_ORYRU|nr:hypothetical protein OsI_36523 [Oryza sativa Indica Group]KAB8115603.1 hypothetical protein EE612_056212 [Oryza sativa]
MVSTRGAAANAPGRRGRPPKAAEEAARSPVLSSPVVAADAAEGYERERAERIRENMERMQKLGILDLATRFNQSAGGLAGSGSGRGRGRRKAPVTPGSVGVGRMIKPASPSPARRSLRLKNVEPVSYCEIRTKKDKDDNEGGNSVLIEAGSKEEVYTEEDEKLLGPCVEPWTLFVDGYGKDGKRIYDQVRGQTCHQCRQKTLGHHTSCCKCQIVQGQFCGDCLYMRYGENVLEAKKNPDWICPVCRGICNCSICRTKKGWFPTGAAYRKVVSLGYKSVAHYLIATQRASPAGSADSNKVAATKSEASSESDQAPVAKEDQEDAEMSGKAIQKVEADHQVNNPPDDSDNDDSRSESVVTSDSQDCQVNLDIGCATPSKPTGPKKRKWIERSPDCVASRLRSRSNKS